MGKQDQIEFLGSIGQVFSKVISRTVNSPLQVASQEKVRKERSLQITLILHLI